MYDLAKETNAWACYDCGKCTSTCPITRAGADYSPRRHVLAANLGGREKVVPNDSLSVCLTCRHVPRMPCHAQEYMKLSSIAPLACSAPSAPLKC